MLYKKLESIIKSKAKNLKLTAEYNGARNDGGSTPLLNRLNDFKQSLIIKYDLKPSEYYKLNYIDIGEPNEFLEIINEYKLNLIQNIKL